MTQDITLNHITKIEGHAKLTLKIDEGTITTCELGASEGARYFEGILIGRRYNEASEITSRICGICSCAHVIAATTAIEHAIGYTPSVQTTRLRILLTLSERIRSHATHLYFLALPDYLGYESALAMAKDYKPQLQAALRMMKVGNRAITLLGGRDLHPVSAAVGGWLKLPKQEQLTELAAELDSIVPDAVATCELFFTFKQPDFHTEGEWFSLSDGRSYTVIDGDFTSSKASYSRERYKEFMHEYHTDYSSSNFVVNSEKRYWVGALARLNNNGKFLAPKARKMLHASGIILPSDNPFHNNPAQAIELLHSIEEAAALCRNITITPEHVDVPAIHAGTGVGAVEVPRGTLWHEYTVDERGMITHANIVTPTAQNLLNMQEDIRAFVPSILKKPRDGIILDVEKLIRSYDPCFSCSAHFLEVDWDRVDADGD